MENYFIRYFFCIKEENFHTIVKKKPDYLCFLLHYIFKFNMAVNQGRNFELRSFLVTLTFNFNGNDINHLTENYVSITNSN